MIGIVGHVVLLLAWIATALTIFGFYQSTQTQSSGWHRVGRYSWFAMSAAVLIASGILYYLLVTHQFQYAYVYQNTSLELPKIFLVSAFWAGQEGSFLLWIGMMVVIGLALIRWAGEYEAPVMTVVGVSQFFLLSMIVGLDLGTISIGSSPFSTLAERFPDAPMLQVPGFIPADGSGLNDLLQNYWMAIHPPTLFVGFAAMVVPFAFAVAALWKRRYVDWVRAALPWTLFAVMALGVGIALGGYWAYVTLSFGGYWAWDPVENSSLVPWLIGVAAFHSMIIQKRSGSGYKAALILSILAYMLVIYSTFLTRSGILGDVSVHSFVDLGLHNQLLIWIAGMGIVGFGLYAFRYRELPSPDKEPAMLSREFLIFSGAMLVTALAAVILVGTSAPILGRIFRDNPSAVPLDFYNTWTLPLSLGFVFLAGIAQLFWWNKMDLATINRVLLRPLSLAVVSTIAVLVFTPFIDRTVNREALERIAGDPMAQMGIFSGFMDFWAVYGTGIQMLLLIFAAFFALYGNGSVLIRVARGNLRMVGGALTHVGFALLVLGIMASSGFSRPLAQATGVQIGDSRDNFVLTRSESRTVAGYQVTYRGRDYTDRGRPEYVLDFVDPRGREYTLRPVVYKSNQDQWIQHPALRLAPDRDLYVAVTPSAMFESDEERAEKGGMISLSPGDSTVIGDREYAVALRRLETRVASDLLPEDTDIAVGAVLEITHLPTGLVRELQPIYLIMQDRTQQYIQNRVRDWNMTVTFTGIELETGTASLAFEGVDVMPEDWIVVQASEKPFINVLWFGFLVMTAGMVVSIVRRSQDARFSHRRRRREEES